MPRIPRHLIVAPSQLYHVIVRGNNKFKIFQEAEDFYRYNALLFKAKKEAAVSLFHYTLMPNHVHLLIKAGKKGISDFMHSIQLQYAKYFSRKYEHVGHVWQGRFKSLLIDNDEYAIACGKYIELNPVRAGLVQQPEDWPHTSYNFYAHGRYDPLVDVDPFYISLGKDPLTRQKNYREHIRGQVTNSQKKKTLNFSLQ